MNASVRLSSRGRWRTVLPVALLLCLPFASLRAAMTFWGWETPPPATASTYQNFAVAVRASRSAEDATPLVVYLYRNGVLLTSQDAGDSEDAVLSTLVYVTITTSTVFEAKAYYNGALYGTLTRVVNDSDAPSAPTGLAAGSQAASSFTLSWSASTDNVGVTAYEVKRDNASLGQAAGTSRVITGLLASTQYAFSVRACDARGNWSAWSSALNVTLTDNTPPSAPTGLVSPTHTSTTIALNWNAATDDGIIVAYDVYRGTQSPPTTNIGSSTTRTFLDTNFTPGTLYYYAVKARDSGSNVSAASNIISVTATSTVADADADGIPDALESILGVQGNPAPTVDSSLNLKPHRPQP